MCADPEVERLGFLGCDRAIADDSTHPAHQLIDITIKSLPPVVVSSRLAMLIELHALSLFFSIQRISRMRSSVAS